MGDMADEALDRMMDEDDAQLRILGTSNVFLRYPLPLSEHEQELMSEDDDDESYW